MSTDGNTMPGSGAQTQDDKTRDASISGYVDRVAVRLPPFWAEDPDVWFAQVEAQFSVSGIKDDGTKFNQVVSQLDQRYVKEVKDLIKNPPSTGKYVKLKQELTKRLSISREYQISQLLSHEELGDRKPSQFLRHLKTLADGGISDEFLRNMWSSRLPQHVQAIIMSQASTSLEDVAELADKICEVSPSSNQVASTSFNIDSLLQRMDQLITSRIQSELSRQISQLTVNRGRNRGRSASRSSGRSRSRGQSKTRTPGMCWYHNIFGDKARKCTAPCNFKSGNSHGSQ